VGDEKRPLTLVFGSLDGWRIGGLPRDFAEVKGELHREPQTVTWRVIIRGLSRDVKRVKLETQNAGMWQVVHEKDMVLPGLKNWISERDGELVFGFAGEVELADANVRIVRDGTLFLAR
jgi:hypothetical protein